MLTAAKLASPSRRLPSFDRDRSSASHLERDSSLACENRFRSCIGAHHGEPAGDMGLLMPTLSDNQGQGYTGANSARESCHGYQYSAWWNGNLLHLPEGAVEGAISCTYCDFLFTYPARQVSSVGGACHRFSFEQPRLPFTHPSTYKHRGYAEHGHEAPVSAL